MFKKILAAVDGSKNSISALEKAVELQKLTGAELEILTVYRHYSLLEASFSMVRPSDPATMDDAMRDHAREIAEEAKEHAARIGARDPRAFVKNGPVARSIVAFADEHGSDVIVIGSRGLGSIEEYLLGSVSHKVTGTAGRPVMVI